MTLDTIVDFDVIEESGMNETKLAAVKHKYFRNVILIKLSYYKEHARR
jgi:hypothetical protein